MNTATSTTTGAETARGVRRWWDADGGWSTADAGGTVLVIDSWFVDEGRVRGLDRHAERFGAACDRFSGPGAVRTNRFLRAVAESLPARGRWFPRVELVETESETRQRLWLRPAPPRTATVRLWAAAGPDRRRLPAVKGADLDHLASLRAAAAAAGADEALLVSAEGHVVEGASTSIVWWRGDTLCGPPPGPGLLPGITRALLGELARTAGHQVVTEQATAPDLAGVPVWTLNALHGIRPVTEGLGRFQDTDAAAAERWQSRLAELAVPADARLIPVVNP
ncbi:aminotransferase class IV [Streptomyces adelaidensis]|uniref:aminotransferase class IV n=1 Tax=Streptomyces adelaidensis TaxID=2796465 RepID=UPI0019088B52|nr:aminotransferase class IV [Streptomyces adelaidensis]